MDKKIRSLVKALEREYGCPVQVSVERPKETEQVLERDYKHLFYPFEKKIYGAMEKRACEVLPLPTDVHEIKHDLNSLIGKYDSLGQLNHKIRKIQKLEFFCFHGLDFDEGLRSYLATKYEVKEKVVGIAHGGKADWYTVDGVEADLDDWKKKRPDLYKESVHYLESNNVPFWYHHLVATPHGVYISERGNFGTYGDDVLIPYFGTNDLESVDLIKKIAEVKLELLK